MIRTVIMTMAVSGALAALTGITEVFGKTGKFVGKIVLNEIYGKKNLPGS